MLADRNKEPVQDKFLNWTKLNPWETHEQSKIKGYYIPLLYDHPNASSEPTRMFEKATYEHKINGKTRRCYDKAPFWTNQLVVLQS